MLRPVRQGGGFLDVLGIGMEEGKGVQDWPFRWVHGMGLVVTERWVRGELDGRLVDASLGHSGMRVIAGSSAVIAPRGSFSPLTLAQSQKPPMTMAV